MNRPTKKEFKFSKHQEEVTYNYDEYEFMLEQYCNELEQQIGKLQFQDHLHYEEYLGYEKALNKACEIISDFDLEHSNDHHGGTWQDRDWWKEYILNEIR